MAMKLSLEMVYLLNIFLLSRLPIALLDQKIKWKDTLKVLSIQIVGCSIFLFGSNLLILFVFLTGISIAIFYLERQLDSVDASRITSLVVYFLFAGFVASPFFELEFNTVLISYIGYWRNSFSYIDLLQLEFIKGSLVVLMGLTLVSSESNYIVRLVLERLNLGKKNHFNSVSEKLVISSDNLKAGRAIGILERITIFFFSLTGEYIAIPFVLTAKSFARFKEMDNKDFAEYVLIGTLLSSLIAMGVAALISRIEIM